MTVLLINEQLLTVVLLRVILIVREIVSRYYQIAKIIVVLSPIRKLALYVQYIAGVVPSTVKAPRMS